MVLISFILFRSESDTFLSSLVSSSKLNDFSDSFTASSDSIRYTLFEYEQFWLKASLKNSRSEVIEIFALNLLNTFFTFSNFSLFVVKKWYLFEVFKTVKFSLSSCRVLMLLRIDAVSYTHLTLPTILRV